MQLRLSLSLSLPLALVRHLTAPNCSDILKTLSEKGFIKKSTLTSTTCCRERE